MAAGSSASTASPRNSTIVAVWPAASIWRSKPNVSVVPVAGCVSVHSTTCPAGVHRPSSAASGWTRAPAVSSTRSFRGAGAAWATGAGVSTSDPDAGVEKALAVISAGTPGSPMVSESWPRPTADGVHDAAVKDSGGGVGGTGGAVGPGGGVDGGGVDGACGAAGLDGVVVGAVVRGRIVRGTVELAPLRDLGTNRDGKSSSPKSDPNSPPSSSNSLMAKSSSPNRDSSPSLSPSSLRSSRGCHRRRPSWRRCRRRRRPRRPGRPRGPSRRPAPRARPPRP